MEDRNTYPKLEKPIPQLVKDYKAFDENKRGRLPRFRVMLADGTVYGFSYGYLMSWVFDPPTLLTLNLSDKVIVITGRNLGRIEGMFLEEKVKTLRAFNAEFYKAPAQNEPFIESIEIS